MPITVISLRGLYFVSLLLQDEEDLHVFLIFKKNTHTKNTQINKKYNKQEGQVA